MLNQETFSFALPEMNSLPSQKSEQAETYLSSVKDAARKSLVLVFSGNVDTRYLFKTFLKMSDFDVAEAENEIELIDAASMKRPDLILMDVALPFSDSLSTMSELQKNNLLEKVPFVLLSGLPQKGYRTAAFAAGAAEYLIKPIDFDLLECSLQLILSDIRKNQPGGSL
jgi:CheY-like chemotaxis protein